MSSDTSTAITSAPPKRRARATAPVPVPVPRSRIRRGGRRQLADPPDHVAQVRVQDLGVEVHELGQRRLVGLVPGMVVVMVVVRLPWLHATTSLRRMA